MKVCTKCGIEKESDGFTKCRRNKSGLHHCCKECLKLYREENKEEIKKWREENKEKIRSYPKKDRSEYMSNYNKNYKILNRETINKYYRDKKLNDSMFKFKCSIRSLIYNSFKRCGSRKSEKTINILGCSFDEFLKHIESQFNDDMSWDNYGYYWEFDHIIQLATAKNEIDILNLNHYTNFQPLEINLNRSKNNKYKYE